MKKQLTVRDNMTGKEHAMPQEQYDQLKNRPEYHLYIKTGYIQPENIMKTWYVDEDEKRRGITNARPFYETYQPDCYMQIVQRIDPLYLEVFIGRYDQPNDFFDDTPTDFSYFSNYNKRKNGFFTFDKITLYELTEIFKTNPIRLILKKLEHVPVFTPNRVFMIMPFREARFKEFFEINVRQFLKSELNIDVYRADDFTDNDIIIETIYNQIETAEFIIAETSTNNKNSFYELGYAVAKQKEVITMQLRSEMEFFFDRAHIRSIVYEFENPSAFTSQLKSTIENIRRRM